MKILILSTFPYEVPQHGGQHRLFNIKRLLEQEGHDVETVGVLGSSSYPDTIGYTDYPNPSDFKAYIDNYFLMDDWAIGELFASNNSYYSLLKDKIQTVPDIIHIEHPWLFKFAERYRNEFPHEHIKLIYGSANIENELKFDILKQYMDAETARQGREKVLQCELHAIKEADMIFCVSENDKKWTEAHTMQPVVLAQNGVRATIADNAGIIEANEITQNRKIALYCASGHPPNIFGFFEIFGNGVGCLSPESRLVVAGSAGKTIQTHEKFNKVPRLQDIFIDGGIVSEACLSGLLKIAHVLVLPINQGGGTNLKTAEALWNGAHVVATRKAMRGFEQFIGEPGVYISDSAAEFCQQLKNAMESPPLVLDQESREKRRAVLWEETLQNMLSAISQLREA